jgi:hypothetical protein
MQDIKKKPGFAMKALFSYALFLVVFAIFCFFECRGNRYISPNILSGLFAAFCLFSIPWWLVTGLIYLFAHKKHWGWKTGAAVLLVVALVVGGSMGSLLLVLSLSSETGNAGDYLLLDKGVTLTDETRALFPERIPEGAQNVQYYYRYGPMMDGGVTVQAAWTLPAELFEVEVGRITALLSHATVSLGDEGETILTVQRENGGALSSGLYAAYNAQDNSLRYFYWGGEV